MLRSIWCLVSMLGASGAWNLATVDDTGLNFVTNNNDYVVLHVSVFYVRSFLAIQSRWNTTTKNPITLIESTWPENLLPIQPRVFPNDLSHAKSICDCNGIIQSIHTAIDRNGMLWLIDNGSIYCPPKLIIYNLMKLNAEVSFDAFAHNWNTISHSPIFVGQVHRYVFNEFKGGSFKSIHLQHKFDSNDINAASEWITCRAIITMQNENYLIIYSQKAKAWRKLMLVSAVEIIPQSIAIRNDETLLVTDAVNTLWMANLTNIKVYGKHRHLGIVLRPLGALLGVAKSPSVPTSGLSSDPNNNYLYYYIPRDGAIVRWDIR